MNKLDAIKQMLDTLINDYELDIVENPKVFDNDYYKTIVANYKVAKNVINKLERSLDVVDRGEYF